MYQRTVGFVAVVALATVLGTGSAPMGSRTAQAVQYAYSATDRGVTFASDPAAYGGGDQEMDNLYTLDNAICTDGIAINIVTQIVGDIHNAPADQGHSLTLRSIQDYGTTAPALPLGFDTAGDPTPGQNVPIQEASGPDGSWTFASGADNSVGSWQGNTYKAHYGSTGSPISEPVGEQIVGTFVRADHGFVVNEDDDARLVPTLTVDLSSNGDDGRFNQYSGWSGTDDGSSANNGPPTSPNVDNDWFVNSSGVGTTDGSSFDDIIRTDQSPTSNLDPDNPNSAPSFDVAPNPDTSRVNDCVIDQAPPQTTATYPAPDQNGWYREAVPVTLAVHKVYYLGGAVTTYYAVDGGSSQTGLSISVQGDGTHTLQYHSEDSASPTPDVESTHSLTFKVDGTAPTVAFDAGTCPTSPVILGSSQPSATWTATDNSGGSGVATAATGSIPLDTSTVGPHTVTAPAPTDVAGNTGTSVPCTYTVIYNFKGFFQPVDNPPVSNTAKAGSTIPVKFSLTGNQGLSIFAAGSPGAQQVDCGSLSSTSSQIDQTVTAGSSSLSYDATADQYTYAWKTDPSWKNTCRVLTVKLVDGTQHQANFSFSK